MEKKIRIFTTPGCNYCAQAKEYLSAKGLDFDAIDVTASPEAMKEMRAVSGGARSVPVIVVGREVIIGFDQGALDRALQNIG